MIKKFIAVTTITAFLGTSLTNPGVSSAQPISEASRPQVTDVNSIVISPDLASVQEKFIAPGDGKKRLTVLIQDAHGIYDAQKNIRAIIQELQDKYGFDLVALEGGVGKADHTIFRTFPDQEINRKQVDWYVQRAELSGGEAAAMTNPREGIFYGIEGRESYFENRGDFLKTLDQKTSNLGTLKLIERKLDKIRDKIYPPELLKFHKQELEFKRERIGLIEFLGVLRDGSSLLLSSYGLTKEPSPSLAKYPNLELIFQAMARDRDGSAKSEPSLTKKEMEEKERELTAKVEGKKLFEEMEVLSGEIKERFFRDGSSLTLGVAKGLEEPSLAGDIKTLDSLYSKLESLEQLASLEISREDYQEYATHKKDLGLAVFLEFLAKYKDTINLTLDLSTAETFYQGALQRDEVLYQNLMKAIHSEKQDRAIAVVGGFHTDGLRERLRKDGISYLILSPRIEKFEEDNPYWKVIQGQVSYKKLGRSQIAAPLITMGMFPEDAERFARIFLLRGLRGLFSELRQDPQFREKWRNADATWRKNIITVVKNNDPFASPEALLRMVAELMKEAATQPGGREQIQATLDHLEKAFSDVVGTETKVQVDKFIGSTKGLLAYLQQHNLSLEARHLALLFDNGLDLSKITTILDNELQGTTGWVSPIRREGIAYRGVAGEPRQLTSDQMEEIFNQQAKIIHEVQVFGNYLRSTHDPDPEWTVGKELSKLRNETLLEVGTGTDLVLINFLINDLGFDPEKIYAIDPTMMADPTGSDPQFTEGRFVKGSISDPLPSSWEGVRFDQVFGFHVFGLFPDEELRRAAENILKVLKPGGKVGGAKLGDSAKRVFSKKFGGSSSPMLGSSEFEVFGKNALQGSRFDGSNPAKRIEELMAQGKSREGAIAQEAMEAQESGLNLLKQLNDNDVIRDSFGFEYRRSGATLVGLDEKGNKTKAVYTLFKFMRNPVTGHTELTLKPSNEVIYKAAESRLVTGQSLGEKSLVDRTRISRIAEEKILGKNALGVVLHARDVLSNLSPQATADDLARRLAELEAKAFGYEELNEERWRKTLDQTPEEVLLLVDPAGRVKGSITQTEEDGIGHLEQIITEQDRTRGRGELLMDAYLDLLRQRGVGIVRWAAALDSAGFYHRYLASRFYYEARRGNNFTVYLDTDAPELRGKWRILQAEYLKRVIERERKVGEVLEGLRGEYVFTERTIPTRFQVREDGSWQYLSGEFFFKNLSPETMKKILVGRLTYRTGVSLWDAAGNKQIVTPWNEPKEIIPGVGYDRAVGRSLGERGPEISVLEQPTVIAENLKLLNDPEVFINVMSKESINTDAGSSRYWLNIVVDHDGRIMGVGNPQDQSNEIREGLKREGVTNPKYEVVGLERDFLSGKIVQAVFGVKGLYETGLPLQAQQSIAITQEEFNKMLAARAPPQKAPRSFFQKYRAIALLTLMGLIFTASTLPSLLESELPPQKAIPVQPAAVELVKRSYDLAQAEGIRSLVRDLTNRRAISDEKFNTLLKESDIGRSIAGSYKNYQDFVDQPLDPATETLLVEAVQLALQKDPGFSEFLFALDHFLVTSLPKEIQANAKPDIKMILANADHIKNLSLEGRDNFIKGLILVIAHETRHVINHREGKVLQAPGKHDPIIAAQDEETAYRENEKWVELLGYGQDTINAQRYIVKRIPDEGYAGPMALFVTNQPKPGTQELYTSQEVLAPLDTAVNALRDSSKLLTGAQVDYRSDAPFEIEGIKGTEFTLEVNKKEYKVFVGSDGSVQLKVEGKSLGQALRPGSGQADELFQEMAVLGKEAQEYTIRFSRYVLGMERAEKALLVSLAQIKDLKNEPEGTFRTLPELVQSAVEDLQTMKQVVAENQDLEIDVSQLSGYKLEDLRDSLIRRAPPYLRLLFGNNKNIKAVKESIAKEIAALPQRNIFERWLYDWRKKEIDNYLSYLTQYLGAESQIPDVKGKIPRSYEFQDLFSAYMLDLQSVVRDSYFTYTERMRSLKQDEKQKLIESVLNPKTAQELNEIYYDQAIGPRLEKDIKGWIEYYSSPERKVGLEALPQKYRKLILGWSPIPYEDWKTVQDRFNAAGMNINDDENPNYISDEFQALARRYNGVEDYRDLLDVIISGETVEVPKPFQEVFQALQMQAPEIGEPEKGLSLSLDRLRSLDFEKLQILRNHPLVQEQVGKERLETFQKELLKVLLNKLFAAGDQSWDQTAIVGQIADLQEPASVPALYLIALQGGHTSNAAMGVIRNLFKDADFKARYQKTYENTILAQMADEIVKLDAKEEAENFSNYGAAWHISPDLLNSFILDNITNPIIPVMRTYGINAARSIQDENSEVLKAVWNLAQTEMATDSPDPVLARELLALYTHRAQQHTAVSDLKKYFELAKRFGGRDELKTINNIHKSLKENTLLLPIVDDWLNEFPPLLEDYLKNLPAFQRAAADISTELEWVELAQRLGWLERDRAKEGLIFLTAYMDKQDYDNKSRYEKIIKPILTDLFQKDPEKKNFEYFQSIFFKLFKIETLSLENRKRIDESFDQLASQAQKDQKQFVKLETARKQIETKLREEGKEPSQDADYQKAEQRLKNYQLDMDRKAGGLIEALSVSVAAAQMDFKPYFFSFLIASIEKRLSALPQIMNLFSQVAAIGDNLGNILKYLADLKAIPNKQTRGQVYGEHFKVLEALANFHQFLDAIEEKKDVYGKLAEGIQAMPLKNFSERLQEARYLIYDRLLDQPLDRSIPLDFSPEINNALLWQKQQMNDSLRKVLRLQIEAEAGKKSAQSAEEAVSSFEGNQPFLNEKSWLKGPPVMKVKAEPVTDLKEQQQRIKNEQWEEVKVQIDLINKKFSSLSLAVEEVPANMADTIRVIEETLSRFREQNPDQAQDAEIVNLSNMLQNLRSTEGLIQSMAAQEVTFYVSEDPIERLNLGVGFQSCLNCVSGSNRQYAAAAALDLNKRVIFVKDQKGNRIGRLTLALSGNKILVTSRFYRNTNLDLVPHLINFLKAYGDVTEKQIVIPKGRTLFSPEEEGRFGLELISDPITIPIERAVTDAFYTDLGGGTNVAAGPAEIKVSEYYSYAPGIASSTALTTGVVEPLSASGKSLGSVPILDISSIPAEAKLAEDPSLGVIVDAWTVSKHLLPGNDEEDLIYQIALLDQRAFKASHLKLASWRDIFKSRRGEIFLLFDEGGRLTGFLDGIHNREKRWASVITLATDPGGPRGRGEFLMDSYMNLSKAKGAEIVEVIATDDAIGFYHRILSSLTYYTNLGTNNFTAYLKTYGGDETAQKLRAAWEGSQKEYLERLKTREKEVDRVLNGIKGEFLFQDEYSEVPILVNISADGNWGLQEGPLSYREQMAGLLRSAYRAKLTYGQEAELRDKEGKMLIPPALGLVKSRPFKQSELLSRPVSGNELRESMNVVGLSLGKSIMDVLREGDIDPDTVTSLIYPAAGNKDVWLVQRLIELFPKLEEVHLISLSYNDPLFDKAPYKKRLLGTRPGLKVVELHAEDYLDFRVPISAKGRRIILDKWPGFNAELRAEKGRTGKGFYDGILADTRPGDLVLAVPAAGYPPAKWPGEIAQGIAIPGYPEWDNWIVSVRKEKDVPRLEGLTRGQSLGTLLTTVRFPKRGERYYDLKFWLAQTHLSWLVKWKPSNMPFYLILPTPLYRDKLFYTQHPEQYLDDKKILQGLFNTDREITVGRQRMERGEFRYYLRKGTEDYTTAFVEKGFEMIAHTHPTSTKNQLSPGVLQSNVLPSDMDLTAIANVDKTFAILSRQGILYYRYEMPLDTAQSRERYNALYQQAVQEGWRVEKFAEMIKNEMWIHVSFQGVDPIIRVDASGQALKVTGASLGTAGAKMKLADMIRGAPLERIASSLQVRPDEISLVEVDVEGPGIDALLKAAEKIKNVSLTAGNGYMVLALSRTMGENRKEYRILVDEASRIRNEAIPIIGGNLFLGESWQFMLNFTEFSNTKSVYLDNVEVHSGLQREGIASQVFETFARFLESNYPGWTVATVAAEEQRRGNQPHNFIPYQMGKFFSAHRAVKLDVESMPDYSDFLKPLDWYHLYVGKVGARFDRWDQFQTLIERLAGTIAEDLKSAQMSGIPRMDQGVMRDFIEKDRSARQTGETVPEYFFPIANTILDDIQKAASNDPMVWQLMDERENSWIRRVALGQPEILSRIQQAGTPTVLLYDEILKQLPESSAASTGRSLGVEGQAGSPLDKKVKIYEKAYGKRHPWANEEYSLSDIVRELEKPGRNLGSFFYEKLSLNDQLIVEGALSPEALGRLGIDRTINANMEEALDRGGAMDRGIYERTLSATAAGLQEKIFELGAKTGLYAHGVEAVKGGLGVLTSILLEGKIREGQAGPLFGGNPQLVAGPHGPFYIILADPNQVDWGKRENHEVYLVPEESDRRVIEFILQKAVQSQVITPEVSREIKSKIRTYGEFVEQKSKEISGKSLGTGATETVSLMHMTSFSNFKNIASKGFYNAINYNTFLPENSGSYPTYGKNDQIEIIFKIPKDLVVDKKDPFTGAVAPFVLSDKAAVDEKEAGSVLGKAALDSMKKRSRDGKIGRIAPEYIDFDATIEKNRKRTQFTGEGSLDPKVFDEMVVMVTQIRGKSLGGELSERDLEVLASEIGLGTIKAGESEKAEAYTKLGGLLASEGTQTVTKTLHDFIMEKVLPGIFADQEASLKLLIQSSKLLSGEAIGKRVGKIVDDISREIPAHGSEEKGRLKILFSSILEGASIEAVQQRIQAEETGRQGAITLFLNNTQTQADRIAMESVIAKLSSDLAERTQNLMSPERKTILVATMASFPESAEQAREMIDKAFQAAPKDVMGPRLNIFIYYTEAEAGRAKGLQGYLTALRKEDPLLASKIQLKRKTRAGLESVFIDHQKRVKEDENLIFLVPELSLTSRLKDSQVLVHKDSNISQELSFVRGIISQAAVGLAEALRLSDRDPKRTQYLNYLHDDLGFTVTRDAERRQFIIGFDLQTLISKLVDLQRAQQAIRIAA